MSSITVGKNRTKRHAKSRETNLHSGFNLAPGMGVHHTTPRVPGRSEDDQELRTRVHWTFSMEPKDPQIINTSLHLQITIKSSCRSAIWSVWWPWKAPGWTSAVETLNVCPSFNLSNNPHPSWLAPQVTTQGALDGWSVEMYSERLLTSGGNHVSRVMIQCNNTHKLSLHTVE